MAVTVAAWTISWSVPPRVAVIAPGAAAAVALSLNPDTVICSTLRSSCPVVVIVMTSWIPANVPAAVAESATLAPSEPGAVRVTGPMNPIVVAAAESVRVTVSVPLMLNAAIEFSVNTNAPALVEVVAARNVPTEVVPVEASAAPGTTATVKSDARSRALPPRLAAFRRIDKV